jgi:hypothetical protein
VENERERERELREIAKKLYVYSRKYNIYVTGNCFENTRAMVWDRGEDDFGDTIYYPLHEEEVKQDAGPSKADSSNQEPDGRAGHAAQSAQTTI